jgi:hypothetical protein
MSEAIISGFRRSSTDNLAGDERILFWAHRYSASCGKDRLTRLRDFRGIDFCGTRNMPPTVHPGSSTLCRDGNDDRLPIHVAGPVIIMLSLSLWGGIGFVISVFL